MAAQAKMVNAWIMINNTNRSPYDDLNLQIGGTVKLNEEALVLLGGKLLTIRVDVMDQDTISDDLMLTNETFQLGIPNIGYHPFTFSVIVPHHTLVDSEPSYEHYVELYCNVSGHGGKVRTNKARTNRKDV